MKEETEIKFFIIKCINQTTSFRESNMNEFLQINLSQNPFHLLCSFLKRVYEETDVNRLTSLFSLMKKFTASIKKFIQTRSMIQAPKHRVFSTLHGSNSSFKPILPPQQKTGFHQKKTPNNHSKKKNHNFKKGR